MRFEMSGYASNLYPRMLLVSYKNVPSTALKNNAYAI